MANHAATATYLAIKNRIVRELLRDPALLGGAEPNGIHDTAIWSWYSTIASIKACLAVKGLAMVGANGETFRLIHAELEAAGCKANWSYDQKWDASKTLRWLDAYMRSCSRLDIDSVRDQDDPERFDTKCIFPKEFNQAVLITEGSDYTPRLAFKDNTDCGTPRFTEGEITFMLMLLRERNGPGAIKHGASCLRSFDRRIEDRPIAGMTTAKAILANGQKAGKGYRAYADGCGGACDGSCLTFGVFVFCDSDSVPASTAKAANITTHARSFYAPKDKDIFYVLRNATRVYDEADTVKQIVRMNVSWMQTLESGKVVDHLGFCPDRLRDLALTLYAATFPDEDGSDSDSQTNSSSNHSSTSSSAGPSTSSSSNHSSTSSGAGPSSSSSSSESSSFGDSSPPGSSSGDPPSSDSSSTHSSDSESTQRPPTPSDSSSPSTSPPPSPPPSSGPPSSLAPSSRATSTTLPLNADEEDGSSISAQSHSFGQGAASGYPGGSFHHDEQSGSALIGQGPLGELPTSPMSRLSVGHSTPSGSDGFMIDQLLDFAPSPASDSMSISHFPDQPLSSGGLTHPATGFGNIELTGSINLGLEGLLHPSPVAHHDPFMGAATYLPSPSPALATPSLAGHRAGLHAGDTAGFTTAAPGHRGPTSASSAHVGGFPRSHAVRPPPPVIPGPLAGYGGGSYREPPAAGFRPAPQRHIDDRRSGRFVPLGVSGSTMQGAAPYTAPELLHPGQPEYPSRTDALGLPAAPATDTVYAASDYESSVSAELVSIGPTPRVTKRKSGSQMQTGGHVVFDDEYSDEEPTPRAGAGAKKGKSAARK